MREVQRMELDVTILSEGDVTCAGKANIVKCKDGGCR